MLQNFIRQGCHSNASSATFMNYDLIQLRNVLEGGETRNQSPTLRRLSANMGYRLQENEHLDNDYVLYDYLDSAN